MVENLGWDGWCDECKEPLGQLAKSLYPTKAELVKAMRADGWKVGKRITCCNCIADSKLAKNGGAR